MKNREQFGIVLVAVIVSLGAVGVAFLSANSSKEGAEARLAIGAVSHAPEELASKDTDGDGVPDWKEALLRTNPHNKDTDGDGVSDGEDGVVGEGEASEAYSAPRALPTTDALARELFSTYAGARSDGVVDEAELQSALYDLAVSQAASSLPAAKTFSLNDLSFKETVNPVTYEASVNAALRKAQAVREYELSVFSRAVADNATAELKKLKATALIYAAIRDDLVALSAPVAVAEEHRALVNSLAAVTQATEGLSLWSGDPLDALLLVNAFSEAEKSLVSSMGDLFLLTRTLKKTS